MALALEFYFLPKGQERQKEELPPCKPPTVVEVRPKVLEAEVVRFQNNKENGSHL